MRCTLAFWFNFKSTQSCVLAFGILGAHWMLATNTSVTGTVADDSGHAVPGARILISYAPSVKAPVTALPVITGP